MVEVKVITIGKLIWNCKETATYVTLMKNINLVKKVK